LSFSSGSPKDVHPPFVEQSLAASRFIRNALATNS